MSVGLCFFSFFLCGIIQLYLCHDVKAVGDVGVVACGLRNGSGIFTESGDTHLNIFSVGDTYGHRFLSCECCNSGRSGTRPGGYAGLQFVEVGQ